MSRYDDWKLDNGIDESGERFGEDVAELVAEWSSDEAKLREAEEMVAGSFDGSHYSDVTLALFSLHETDGDKLIGSDVLARLYALAKVEHAAMTAELTAMAEAKIAADDADWDDARFAA